MKISYFETTHQGARKNNQDYYAHLITECWSLFIVADGLGGSERGEVAAKAFCEACVTCANDYATRIQDHPLDSMPELISDSAKLMRDCIRDQYGVLNTQTVFALVWLTENHVITAHVGDARVYRLSENQVWRTPDHTMVQKLFEKHKIAEEDFGTHPLQNRLMNAISTYEEPLPEVFLQPRLGQDETLLLCSDGFWGHLSKQDLQDIANSMSLQETIQSKISDILAQYSAVSDNITVQTVRLL